MVEADTKTACLAIWGDEFLLLEVTGPPRTDLARSLASDQLITMPRPAIATRAAAELDALDVQSQPSPANGKALTGTIRIRLAPDAQGYFSLILYAVTPSVPAAGEWLPDKLAHAMAYGGQTVLLYWVLMSLARPLTATLLAWLLTGALGMLTEILQALQRARNADPGDLMADMVGATIVTLAATLVRRALWATRVA